MSEERETFEGWCLLELMGHRKLAGYVREVSIAGAGFLRIGVPLGTVWAADQFYAPGAVYCITPVTEDLARRFASRCQPEPVTRWELPAAVVTEPACEDCGNVNCICPDSVLPPSEKVRCVECGLTDGCRCEDDF